MSSRNSSNGTMKVKFFIITLNFTPATKLWVNSQATCKKNINRYVLTCNRLHSRIRVKKTIPGFYNNGVVKGKRMQLTRPIC